MRVALRCTECGAPWDREHDHGKAGWRVFFTCDQPPQPVVYCPGCAPPPAVEGAKSP